MEPQEERTTTQKFCDEVAHEIVSRFDELDRMDILRKILSNLKELQLCVVNERKAVAEKSQKALDSMTF